MIKGVPFMTILIATMTNVNSYFYGFRISYCVEVEPQTIKMSPNSKALISSYISEDCHLGTFVICYPKIYIWYIESYLPLDSG